MIGEKHLGTLHLCLCDCSSQVFQFWRVHGGRWKISESDEGTVHIFHPRYPFYIVTV